MLRFSDMAFILCRRVEAIIDATTSDAERLVTSAAAPSEIALNDGRPYGLLRRSRTEGTATAVQISDTSLMGEAVDGAGMSTGADDRR